MVFSAHGVPKSVPEEAQRRKLFYLDATCPLVQGSSRGRAPSRAGRNIILIGHAGHPEVIGTMGQLPPGAVDPGRDGGRRRSSLSFRRPATPLAYITQTTLSVDDTAGIVAVLRRRFPDIAGPHKEDICYATTNRQEAIKAIAPHADIVPGRSARPTPRIRCGWSRSRARPAATRAFCPERGRDRLGLDRRACGPSASRRAPRRPRCW